MNILESAVDWAKLDGQIRRHLKPAEAKAVVEQLLRLIPPTQAWQDGKLVPHLNAYIPISPYDRQIQFLMLDCLDAFYGGAAGGGKDLQLLTPIATVDGWKTMGELVVGDQVFDETGVPCRVVAKSEVFYKAAYKVIFSDGSEVVTGPTHEWVTSNYHERIRLLRVSAAWRVKRQATRPSMAKENKSFKFTASITARNKAHPPSLKCTPTIGIRTTAEIAQTLISYNHINHSVAVAGALQLGVADLPLDPYVLGAWLGDGSKIAGILAGLDEPIFAEVANAGYQFTRYATHISIKGLMPIFRQLGVYNNKHIPRVYLRASAEQRLALLQGLMDTDGSCAEAGFCMIGLTRKQLADDVLELILSLGIKCTMTERAARVNGKYCGQCYVMKFLSVDQVFRLPRKLIRQKRSGFRGTHQRRYIVGVESAGMAHTQCIQVDSPSHCYLVGKMLIPTHNSVALLASAAQFLDVPGYHALVLRRSFSELNLPGALMDVASEWWGGKAGVRRLDGGRQYEFNTKEGSPPSSITFGYLENTEDRRRYQSAQFHAICVDEVTDFNIGDFTFMFSRLRNPPPGVPLRMRGASNPNGPGRQWVKARYVDELTKDPAKIFIPARIDDNIYMREKDVYKTNLATQLGPIEAAQLLRGDWDAQASGKFARQWFKVVMAIPTEARFVRYWDLAATEPAKGKDPSWTTGTLMGMAHGQYFVADVVRARTTPRGVEELVKQTAHIDGSMVQIVMEQEPGSAGVNVIAHYMQLLAGYAFKGDKVTGPRELRANPLASQAEAGNVYLKAAKWNKDFLDEIEVFPGGGHDDQVTSSSGAFNELTGVPVVDTRGIFMFGERLQPDW